MTEKILNLIKQEEARQRNTLMLIPSENYTYPEVRTAVGSVLMHKYAEGQPSRRYYTGNCLVDEIESLCQKRALKAFNLSDRDFSANVQPHSGSEANLAVVNALLKPGDKILSLSLPMGGHLSHGWQTENKKVTLVSKVYQVEFYGVDAKTQLINYQALKKQAEQFKPKLIISGGTAYPREIDYQKISQIAKSVGAYYLADIAHEAGLIAGGALTSPFPYADVVSMTTHKTLRGPRGAIIIAKNNLIEAINASVFPSLQGGPHLHTIAGIAITLKKTKTKTFKTYARQTIKNAQVLARELDSLGFTLVSGGTDKHLILLDLRPQKISGRQASEKLEQVGIITNRNTIPFDNASAFNPSGLRLGTPAVTVRGMKEREMVELSQLINQVLKGKISLKRAKAKVAEFCRRFPLDF